LKDEEIHCGVVLMAGDTPALRVVPFTELP
jgi:hypothetical protein